MAKRLTLKEKVLRLLTDKHTAADISEAVHALEWRAKRRISVELRPGTNVTFNRPRASGRLPHNSRGTVVRRLQKNILVDFGPRGEWRIPPSLLKVGGDGAPAQKVA